MEAHFHLMTIDTDGQVKFEKILQDPESNNILTHKISCFPHRMMMLELSKPYPKKYTVWNCHLKIDIGGEELVTIELLDPDETTTYPKLL